MGLTYKALKYRDIKVNMTKAKSNDVRSDIDDVSSVQQISSIANKSSSMLTDETTTGIATTTDNQQQFTADHIMQLCLFLAEKSRAKQLQQHQEMNARRYYENFLKETNDFGEDEKIFKDNDCNLTQTQIHTASNKLKSPTIKHNLTTALQTSPRTIRRTKLKSEKNFKQTILTDKLSTCANNNTNPNYNSFTEIYEKSTQNTHSHQEQQSQQQDKRDILLKIRQQIFERKRLRQMLNVGQQQNYQYQQQQQHRLNYDIAPLQQQQDELQQLTDVWRPW